MGFVKTFSAVQKIYFVQFETFISGSVTWQSGFTFFEAALSRLPIRVFQF